MPTLLTAFALTAAVLAPQRQSQAEREAMWPAPTAEDWAKSVLVTFQRTWEDATRLSQETGRPILVCTNMDGEIASEHYAGIRYRQPEIAKLYEPYVCVIASVYRHTPRDHDEHGRRIECPRFGSVTCSEHIALEPLVYERFFDGVRVAPRHVMVETDGREVYDVYYAFDTQSVFDRIAQGIAERPAPAPVVRGDRSIVERVESADVADRRAVEGAYEGGDAALKRALLEKAAELGPNAPLELLRRALFGFDPELAALARRTLAQAESEEAVHLITEVLRTPLPQAEREPLVTALERLGERHARARTVASVQRALGSGAATVDRVAWARTLSVAREAPPPSRDAYERAARQAASAARAAVDPVSAVEQRVAAAEAHLALADDPATDRAFARLLTEDAHTAASEALRAGADGWRVHAVLARTAHERGDAEAAWQHAGRAMATPPEGATDRTSMVVLALYVHGRERAIRDALAEKREWPREWLADLHAAYELLAVHPYGLPEHVVAHHDLLRRLGALSESDRVLQAGLERFPAAPALHARLCERLLVEQGAEGLEAAYARRLDERPAETTLHAFAGYASRLAAETHRRFGRVAEALAAYERALAHFERAQAQGGAPPILVDHEAALVLAGRARIALERRDHATALAELERAFERAPAAAVLPDGLNVTPGDTARMLRPRLVRAGDDALVARLDAALERLAAVDPALLSLPDYERPATPGGGR